jgi:hypothetical protein
MKLDAGRVDTVFKVGDQVLLQTKELLDTEDIGKLLQKWEGPFTVTACPSPNAYTLALLQKMHCIQNWLPDSERGQAQTPPHAGRRPSCSGPSV